ncbi:MAG: AAA family ATPase [Lachnospiraceae bacterium]|nr:AAA family ATPase [Lachnospiraceae bacterium]
MERTDLLELIDNYIDPAGLCYQDWLNVGMALKEEGYSSSDWEAWSRKDAARYHQGECARKWESFNGTGAPVTGGTIVQMAMERGWRPKGGGHELDWDDVISEEKAIVDRNWIEGREIVEPGDGWDPQKELITYLETLFEASETVGFVTHSFEKDGKHMPSKGVYDKTAGQLIQELYRYGDDIGYAIGDYKREAGAWIRFNPLDGKGVKNENVTDYRYALVESDDMEIEKQNAVIRELELPVACLVHSGGKSLHAVVRVDAANYQEYRNRVDYLYKVCEKNGLMIDTQNRNPSRLSRMPGVMRGDKKQFLVDTNIGKRSWDEWHEWIEGISDDLPEPEGLDSVWDNMPELSPCLIESVLRKGHKMLIAGPSKAGKSFLQIELCIAIAEGKKWIDWQCAQGRVMYVNLELDRASCLHRFRDVYEALGWTPNNLGNIDIWNLRGKSVPMDKLAPKLIRRAAKKDYVAIIIDPIYKVITGDENSADQMAAFCNQFDKVCTELGCAVIYCHHHSKGSQGGKKSMDRASGSGVFARDPDALLDLIGLETTEALMKQEENKAVCAACRRYLDRRCPGYEEEVSLDDMLSSVQMLDYCRRKLSAAQFTELNAMCCAAAEKVKALTAWRIDGTLREFPKFEPVNLWFDYPVHRLDDVGILKDIQPDAEKPAWQKAAENRKKQAEGDRLKKRNAFEIEFSNIEMEGREVPAQELAEKLDTNSRELLSWLGDTKRQKRDLKKDFEKYIGEDGKSYIRRKETGTHD